MATIADPFNLRRFVDAQDPVYGEVLRELRNGRKESHWMWFIFPQIRGLGRSRMAEIYALSSLGEATAYAEDPVLGQRLRECVGLVNRTESRTVEEIFGNPDGLKFRSSLTLFARAASENRVFREALEKYYRGEEDPVTLELLKI